MPNCFQLIDKTTNEPARFCDIDDKLCNHFGVTPDKHLYYEDWYDGIGFRLACGKSFDEIVVEYQTDPYYNREYSTKMTMIVQWLRERYNSSAWYERKS